MRHLETLIFLLNGLPVEKIWSLRISFLIKHNRYIKYNYHRVHSETKINSDLFRVIKIHLFSILF